MSVLKALISISKIGIYGLAFVGLAAGAPVPSAPRESLPDELFAVVNGQEISAAEFRRWVAGKARARFYHAGPPEAERERFAREVGEELIDRTILLAEADRRGLQPDQAKVEERLKRFVERNSRRPDWPDLESDLLPQVRRQFREDDVAKALEEQIRGAVGAPTAKQLRGYYESNKDAFTTPAQYRVSLILLPVEPWAPGETWQAKLEEAAALRARILGGEPFEKLARERSGDPSAERGGDMGYLHREMLGQPIQERIDSLAIGQVAEPVRLLEGIAVVRLDERREPEVNPLERVAERAAALWRREEQQRAWQAFLHDLRAGAVIEVNDRLYER